MKKIIIILALMNLGSTCFAQDDGIRLLTINGYTANKIFKAQYPNSKFEFPLSTIWVDFGNLEGLAASVYSPQDCADVIANTFSDYAVAATKEKGGVYEGYASTYFSTENTEHRTLIKLSKGDKDILWSIRYDYFAISYRDGNNNKKKAYVCYAYDLNKNDHVKIFDPIRTYDENGKLVTPDTILFPPVKK